MADLDDLDCNPRCLLGWPIKTRTQIWLNWIVPTALELFVYLVLIVADCSVVALHFLDGNPHWGALTLTFVWVPVFLCFCSIITSPWQWPDYYATDIDEVDDGEGGGGGGGAGGGGGGASKPCLLFILRLTANVLLFPVFAVFRCARDNIIHFNDDTLSLLCNVLFLHIFIVSIRNMWLCVCALVACWCSPVINNSD